MRGGGPLGAGLAFGGAGGGPGRFFGRGGPGMAGPGAGAGGARPAERPVTPIRSKKWSS